MKVNMSKERAEEIIELLRTRGGHLDNTNASCRIDWQNHDCCYHCNTVQAIFEAAARELD